MRRNYKVWEEGEGPDFVLEVASLNTWREDVERKPAIYAGLGVKEYFLYDPRGEYLTPRLQGYRLAGGVYERLAGGVYERLAGGVYERLAAVESIDRALTLRSRVLGLELRAKGEEMRFHDPATGQTLLSHAEEHAVRMEGAAALQAEASARRAAERRAEREAAARHEEAAARRAAEARVAELEARLREGR